MKYKIKPWNHQEETIEKCYLKNYYALFYEMGAGKTATAINIMRMKYFQHGKILPTLILSPLIVVENWKREFEMHSEIPMENIITLKGSGTQRIKEFKKAITTYEGVALDKIFITNIDALSMKAFWSYIKEYPFEALIIDESHRFKNPTASRTKEIIKFSDRPNLKYKFILTGSPILNSEMDIWSQFRILNRDIFDDNYYVFRSRYFIDANARNRNVNFPNFKINKKSVDALNKIIYTHADRVVKEECLDLPEFVRQTVEVELSKEQARLYKDMKQDFVTYLGDKAMVADLALTKALRLQQLVSGIFKSDDKEVIPIENKRNKILSDLIEDLIVHPENKIIIWSVFVQSYLQIAKVVTPLSKKYKFSFRYLTGQQNINEKEKAVDDFNTKPKVRIIIANQAAGGTGINLTAANYSIYYSRSFSLEHDLQSEARNYRGGQTRKTTRIDLVAKDTIDEHILKALHNKEKMSEVVLRLKDSL